MYSDRIIGTGSLQDRTDGEVYLDLCVPHTSVCICSLNDHDCYRKRKILQTETSLILNIQPAQRRGRLLLGFLCACRAVLIDSPATANKNKDTDHVTNRGAVALVTPGLVELQVMYRISERKMTTRVNK